MPTRKKRSKGSCLARLLHREVQDGSRWEHRPREPSAKDKRHKRVSARPSKSKTAKPFPAAPFHVGASTKPRAARTLDFEQAMDTSDLPTGSFNIGAPAAPRKPPGRPPGRPKSRQSAPFVFQATKPPDQAPMETEETTGVKFELGPSSSEKKKNRRPKHVRRVDQDALDAYDEAGRCYERGDYETAVKHYTSCLNSKPQGWSLAAKSVWGTEARRGRCSGGTTTRSTTATRPWSWSLA